MALFPISEKSEAYVEGFRNGEIDSQLGYRSDLVWHCINDLNEYARQYSEGYRDGWKRGQY